MDAECWATVAASVGCRHAGQPRLELTSDAVHTSTAATWLLIGWPRLLPPLGAGTRGGRGWSTRDATSRTICSPKVGAGCGCCRCRCQLLLRVAALDALREARGVAWVLELLDARDAAHWWAACRCRCAASPLVYSCARTRQPAARGPGATLASPLLYFACQPADFFISVIKVINQKTTTILGPAPWLLTVNSTSNYRISALQTSSFQ